MLLERGKSDRGVRRSLPAEGATLLTSPCPQTLHALIASRLDGLSADDRALIHAAAVLGQTFTIDALAAVTGDDTPGPVEAPLRALVQRELLTSTWTRDRRSGAKYGYSPRAVDPETSPTARLAKRERRVGTWRQRATSRRSVTTGWPASSRATTRTHTPRARRCGGRRRGHAGTDCLRAAAGRLAGAGVARPGGHVPAASPRRLERCPEVAALYEEIAGAELLAGAWGRSHAAAAEAVSGYEALGDVVGRGRAASTLGECLLVESDIQAAADLLDSALAGLPATGAEALGGGSSGTSRPC